MTIHSARAAVTFRIFRTSAGRWCACKGDGMVAGTFFDHDAAVRFAQRESCGCRLQCIEEDLASWTGAAASGIGLLMACSGGVGALSAPSFADAVELPAKTHAPATWRQVGTASWYGPGHHGKRTASGARFDMSALTAAHRSLPLGTLLRVENLANGRVVLVRVNDRGPFSGQRIVDLSRAAARRIGLEASGTGRVALSVVAQR
jgi:rare lipoprotein A (peptidoglycan hydrolase)